MARSQIERVGKVKKKGDAIAEITKDNISYSFHLILNHRSLWLEILYGPRESDLEESVVVTDQHVLQFVFEPWS